MSDPADLLLFFLSHRGEMREGALLEAAYELLRTRSEEERRLFMSGYKQRLLWLGHICLSGTFWKTAMPSLVLLPSGADSEHNEAIFTGARTPDALAEWTKTAACAVAEEALAFAPRRIVLLGTIDGIASAAERTNLPLLRNAPFRALAEARSFTTYAKEAPAEAPPTDALFEVCDIESGDWQKAAPQVGDACRHKPTYGATRYWTRLAQGFVRAADAGEAVMQSAFAHGKIVCEYQAELCRFIAPRDLPRSVARAFCLCSGRPPQTVRTARNRRAYENVPPALAQAALKRLGQSGENPRKPTVFWFD